MLLNDRLLNSICILNSSGLHRSMHRKRPLHHAQVVKVNPAQPKEPMTSLIGCLTKRTSSAAEGGKLKAPTSKTNPPNMAEYWKSTVSLHSPQTPLKPVSNFPIAEILVQILLRLRKRHQTRAHPTRSHRAPPRQHPALLAGPAQGKGSRAVAAATGER